MKILKGKNSEIARERKGESFLVLLVSWRLMGIWNKGLGNV